MLRPVIGTAAKSGIHFYPPNLHCFYRKEFSFLLFARHKGCLDGSQVEAKGGKHSTYYFSCFNCEYIYSKGMEVEEKTMGVGRAWKHNPV